MQVCLVNSSVLDSEKTSAYNILKVKTKVTDRLTRCLQDPGERGVISYLLAAKACGIRGGR